MPRPQRSEQFDPAEVSVVHVVQRCVRRAWLAGVDPLSGNDYSFRREWIRRRIEALASVFAVDVLAYAVLTITSTKSFAIGPMSSPLGVTTKSLCVGSRCFPAAESMANAQDDCTGRFWEGRFKA